VHAAGSFGGAEKIQLLEKSMSASSSFQLLELLHLSHFFSLSYAAIS
jgi:hypothetical protein